MRKLIFRHYNQTVKMKRFTQTVLIVSFLTFIEKGTAQNQKQPNIVVIIADDLVSV